MIVDPFNGADTFSSMWFTASAGSRSVRATLDRRRGPRYASRVFVNGGTTARVDGSARRFSTGLPFLDRRIGGGLTAGCLLALTAPPQSQSELLLRQLVRTRRTLYVSLTRPAPEVERWATMEGRSGPDRTVLEATPQELLDGSVPLEERLVPECFVIIDRANGLENAERGPYLAFLDRLKTLLHETDSVGVLHCSHRTPSPSRRGLTLDRVDQVWQLELLRLSREIKTRLLVTKSRNGRALREPIDILLTDRVQVDTSRRIS